MFKIKFNSLLSIILSKTILFISRKLLKSGSNFPGIVALKIDKQILKTLANGFSVILITGTNGKTTTTSMIYNIINKSGKYVIANSSGANMLPGIVTAFINDYKFIQKITDKYAIIEVDEANLRYVTNYVKPKIIAITNLFRDQLDRYGEVYTTLSKIIEGISVTENTVLVLNGDDPLLGNLNIKNRKKYYGFNLPVDSYKDISINSDAKFCAKCKAPYKYSYISYAHLGNFYCPKCGYKRPDLDFHVDFINELNSYYSSVKFNGNDFIISQSGLYNIYNALCSYSICKELNISDQIIRNTLVDLNSHFGRQEKIKIDSKEIEIILVKNPAGYNQTIDTLLLDKQNFSVAFLLNDNYADGRDISWIWDVDFEKMCELNIDSTFVSGLRLYDMAVRLKIAGFDMSKSHLIEGLEEMIELIKNCNSLKIYILANYTAMISFRKHLNNKGYIEKSW